MKIIIIFSGLFLTFAPIKAQVISKPLNDSTVKFKIVAPVLIKRSAPVVQTTQQEIDSLLNVIMNKYVTQQNTAKTWTMVRSDADALLLGYFQKGKLVGTTAAEAYYVKIGINTMTANDITNNKMILICGIALIKPAEFSMLRKEKIVAK